MIVTSTELQNNFGKYLIIAAKEDVIITKNGTQVAQLKAGDSILNQKQIMDDVVREEAPDYYFVDHSMQGKRASYEEFLALTKGNEERYEYIDGQIFVMDSPKTPHQSALVELIGSFYNWFQGKSCRPMIAPYDIKLSRNKKDINVVQPDLMVICDLEEMLGADGYYKGVPKLTLEVLSEGNTSKDMIRKMNLYKDTGVEEYWLVDPFSKTVFIYQFKNATIHASQMFNINTNNIAESFLFQGLSVELAKVFR